MGIPLKYNYRYLVTRWVSTGMTALTFALVVSVFIIVMSLANGLKQAFVSTGDERNIIVLRPGVQAEGQSSLQIDRFQIIETLPGIEKGTDGEPLVAPEVLVLVNKPRAGDGKPTNLQIRGVHKRSFELRPQVKIVEGKNFTPGLRQVIVSKSVSNRFASMKIGNKVFLGKGEWEVVGIYDAQRTAYDSELWTDYQELMIEFDRNAYSTCVMRAMDVAAAQGLKELIEGDQRLKMEAKSEKSYFDDQTRNAKPLQAFGAFLAVMMAIGACFAGMNTLYASVANRSREIGTMRVMGFTQSSILICFLIESVLLAGFGGALGCLFSLPINGLATGTTNFQTFSEVVFYFTITPKLMGIGIGFSMMMGLVGGFLPAVSASRQPIIKTLKAV